MRALYPFESRYLSLPGSSPIRLHYLDEGRGEPIVCLHGNPTWSFYYRNLVLALRGSHRVVVPDHVGCGLSDKPGDRDYEYVLERRVSDLEALLDHLALREVTLVLHDWGGMIGLAWAARHPERVARLVILNTAGFRLPEAKPLPWTLWAVRNVRPFGSIAVRGFNAFSGLATRMAVMRVLDEKVRRGLTAPYDSWKNRIATLRFVQDIPLGPGDRSWEAVLATESGLERLRDRPMIVCWGEKDFVFDDHFLEEWRHRFPEAEVHVFPDAGHYVLEDAHERVIPLVSDFLARHPLRTAAARDGVL
ncbi:alpha/beta fold hydrolase [bacterium]|nr:alpha/beta fold hydrolase [bacterium]